jgi:uncharacterized membrane protein
MNLRKTFVARQIHAHLRLFIAVWVGVLTALFLPAQIAEHEVTRLLIGWNAGVCLYLVLSAAVIARSTPGQICYRAQLQDEGRWFILILVNIAAVASLAAIVAELSAAKALYGEQRYAHMGLAAFTILSSWIFTHLMFAVHYAHDYYLARSNSRPVGLLFPDEENPDYGDFLYFSFVIGTSAQTADVSLTSKPMRRIGLVHCVLSFIFNTTVLALTINIAASLF